MNENNQKNIKFSILHGSSVFFTESGEQIRTEEHGDGSYSIYRMDENNNFIFVKKIQRWIEYGY